MKSKKQRKPREPQNAQKPRFSIRRSLGAKMTLVITLIALIIGGTAITFSYFTYQRSLRDQLTETATNLAYTMADLVDPESIDRYLETGETDEAYEQTLERLRIVQRDNELEYAVVTKPTEDGFYYIYDTDTSDDAFVLGDFQEFYPGAFLDNKENFLAGNEIPIIVTNYEFGWLMSAVVPIKDDNGVMHGYVDVDVSMNEIMQMQHYFLLNILVLLASLAVVLAVAGVFVSRRMLVTPINRLSEATSSFVRRGQQGDGLDRTLTELDHMSSGDEVGRLYQSIRQMESDIFDYIDDLTVVTAEKERIGAELSVATTIQASMLPCIFPPFPGRHEFDIYATMTPAKEVGGDFYDFFLIDDDHLAMTIADVSGKGVPAALFMVITKVLLKNSAQSGKTPHEVLEEVNTQLCANNAVDMFVTVWLGILEISTGKLTCANAGHEYPVLCRAGSGYELVRDKHGFVVAGMEGSRYRDYTLELHKGDSLFVYTDGVPESTNAANELFGTDRMVAALNRHVDDSVDRLLPEMKSELDGFVAGAPQFDDITMLVMRYNGNDGK